MVLVLYAMQFYLWRHYALGVYTFLLSKKLDWFQVEKKICIRLKLPWNLNSHDLRYCTTYSEKYCSSVTYLIFANYLEDMFLIETNERNWLAKLNVLHIKKKSSRIFIFNIAGSAQKLYIELFWWNVWHGELNILFLIWISLCIKGDGKT